MIQNSYEKNDKGVFYIVPTPIGNMDDMTFRAIQILSSVEFILCEDTRVTMNLLKHFNIEKKTKSCHKFNEISNVEFALSLLKSGKDIAYVSDRGTPMISDPGFLITQKIVEQGFNIVALPGCTAFVPALNMSNISNERFYFYGFLRGNDNVKKNELKNLLKIPATIILYEAPHRLISTLNLINDVFNNPSISICREITKLHEEVFRGSTTEAIEYYRNEVRGEIVVIIDNNRQDIECVDYDEFIKKVSLEVFNGKKSKDAIKEIAKSNGISRNELYEKYESYKRK